MQYIHKPSSRARRVHISVSPSGAVVVTTPLRFPASRIPPLLAQAKDWIVAQQAQQAKKPLLLSMESVVVFGKRYSLVHSEAANGEVQVQVHKVSITLAPLATQTWKSLLERWLQSRSKEYIVPRVYTLAQTMGLTFKGLAFKQQKTRWGSCSSDKNLNFNWKLIHAPRPVIDYVIIHELAHLVHMNHGRQFWELVAKYDPDYPHHKRWLAKYGATEE